MPRQPDERLLAIWREIGEAIESGDIQGLFVVWEHAEGVPDTACACRTNDLDRLLEAVRHHAIRVKTRHMH